MQREFLIAYSGAVLQSSIPAQDAFLGFYAGELRQNDTWALKWNMCDAGE
jgi:hypothetical protein